MIPNNNLRIFIYLPLDNTYTIIITIYLLFFRQPIENLVSDLSIDIQIVFMIQFYILDKIAFLKLIEGICILMYLYTVNTIYVLNTNIL